MLRGLQNPEQRMNVGKTLFAQVMEFVPWKSFGRIVARYRGDASVRTLSCTEVFRIMAFAQLTWRESLRDIEACLAANQAKLFHMGITAPPARSTLADALNLRDWRIYHALAQRLIARAKALYAEQPSVLELDASVYALDSTTIDLCLNLFDWASFRTTKAAIKLHTLLDLRGAIPTFIHISDGKLHDVNVLDILPIEAGTYYVMDRGYVDFLRLYRLEQASAFFVTRAKKNMAYTGRARREVDKTTGLRSDQTIVLAGPKSSRLYPDPLRRIVFCDLEHNRRFVFLTNNFALPALTIAQLYKSRWQIELFFKWIKQHLRIKAFYGNTDNAVKTQIWIAISIYVLVAIVKKELGIDRSLYEILQILSLTLFEKTPIFQHLTESNIQNPEITFHNQRTLFDL